MSFSSELKGELARTEVKKKCCMLADISGFLRVSAVIRLAGGGTFDIVASTENPAIARHYKKLIKEYFGSTANLEVSGSQAPGKMHTGGFKYSLRITPDEKSSQILRETGILLIKEGNDYFSDGIYTPIVKSKCCKRAYIRGMFLGCGSVTNPAKEYHLEFVLETEQMAQDLKKLIGTFDDLSANIAVRSGKYIVYMKKAEYVSDTMGIMGAGDKLLDFENITISKGIRREAQRIMNCDTANMDRTLSASEEQIESIRIIDRNMGLDNLPAALREVAEIRLARPEASLTEIGEALSPPIKKPGVSKRFAKIKEIADSYRRDT